MSILNITKNKYKDLAEVLAVKEKLLSEGYIEIPGKLSNEVFRFSSSDGSVKYSAIDTLDFDFRIDCPEIYVVRCYLLAKGANAPIFERERSI
jgi:hypothetical protein